MPKVRKGGNAPGQQHETLFPDDLKEVHVDGVAAALLGFPFCKIAFYQVLTAQSSTEAADDSDARLEQRQAALVLNVSAPVLIDMCTNILNSFRANRDQAAKNADAYKARFVALLEGLPPESAKKPEGVAKGKEATTKASSSTPRPKLTRLR